MLPRLLDGQLLGLKSLIWTQLIVIPAIPLLVVLEMLNSGSVNLKCTQYAIQTTRVVHGKARKTFSFPVNEVTQFQYVEEPNPFNGRSRYLSFVAGGKLIKCLTGLKRAEAKLILNELDRMGFDVVRTPAMSITVQGEQSAGRPGPGDRSSPR